MAVAVHFVTANRLETGDVVYRSADGGWVASLTEARRFRDVAARDEALAQAKREESLVCGPYAFDALESEDGTLQLSARERFRRDGAQAARARLGYSDAGHTGQRG